ncbi:LPS assembly lipoprotein LptE [Piscinibacter sakaiensis]|uniref:LPS-assembly lipoprotein LptE n=1 Tax=Piscinibacter sakaiensis TaxID=1547922 RepID=UPI003AACF305
MRLAGRPLRPNRRLLLGSLLAASLAGCGFQLRRAPEMRFRTVMLRGFAERSPLAEELRANIDASSTTRVVETLGQADVVLEALTEARERSVVASSGAGQVRELQLRLRFSFQLSTPSGRVLLPPRQLLLSRDMSYSETIALAKEQEEAALFRAMQSDIVAQVMRRLASVNDL